MHQYLKQTYLRWRRRLYSFLLAILSPLFYQKAFEIYKFWQKWNIFHIFKKSSSQEMFAISLSSCSRYNANFKLDQSVLAIHDSPLYYEISEDDLPRTVTHARDHWWTLDFANAFVSPGVNNRAELVLSHGASRRWLGD
jgi:hypothetical protein